MKRLLDAQKKLINNLLDQVSSHHTQNLCSTNRLSSVVQCTAIPIQQQVDTADELMMDQAPTLDLSNNQNQTTIEGFMGSSEFVPLHINKVEDFNHTTFSLILILLRKPKIHLFELSIG